MKQNVFFGILKRKENSNPLKIIKISYFLKNKYHLHLSLI